MNKRAIWLTIAAFSAACGGGGDDKKKDNDKPPAKPPEEPKPAPPEPPPPAPDAPVAVELTDLGMQIDAPAAWTMKQLKPELYKFNIPSPAGTNSPPRLDVTRLKKGGKEPPPKTVDIAAKACPAKVIEKKALEGGGFYYVCEQTANRRTLRNFRLILPEASGDAISCLGVAADVSALLTACQSLRPI
jgi:hypothetical protein